MFRRALTLTLLLTAAGASAQTPAPTPQAPGLTLAAAIEQALGANRTIAAARLQRPIDAAGLGVAGERPNPELSYELSKETPRQAIGVTLPIELGGKRQRRIDVANATVAVSDADLTRVIAEVRNDVRRAYFEVVAADARVTIAEDVRALATRARDAANARVVAGDVPQSDLTQAELTLLNTENDYTAARGEAAATRAELNALLGQPPDTAVVPAETLTSGVTPVSLAEALALAGQSNGELLVLDRRIAEQTAKINLARALQTSDVAAGSTFTYDSQPEFQYGWRLSLGVTLPVFTRHHAGVLAEEATLARIKAEREAVVARTSGQISAALLRASAAREQLTRYQTDILPRAIEAERQAQAAYNGGQIGLPALVQALQIARDTRQRGLQAGLDYQRALADLERAIGAAIR
jgi:cobalt-zinc-cadmium efflux system outer membrane protein